MGWPLLPSLPSLSRSPPFLLPRPLPLPSSLSPHHHQSQALSLAYIPLPSSFLSPHPFEWIPFFLTIQYNIHRSPSLLLSPLSPSFLTNFDLFPKTTCDTFLSPHIFSYYSNCYDSLIDLSYSSRIPHPSRKKKRKNSHDMIYFLTQSLFSFYFPGP